MTIHHHRRGNQAIASKTEHLDPFDPLDAFDHESAHRDGWTIADCGAYSDGSRRVELQRLNNPPPGSPAFAEDRDAWLHVVQQARSGSFLHNHALQLVDRRQRLGIEAHCGTW